jgi:gluconolactonase
MDLCYTFAILQVGWTPGDKEHSMRASVSCILLTELLAVVSAAELPAPTGETVVAPDARLELLFTRSANIRGGLTEGPAVAPDGSIYFTDIPFGEDKGMILRFDPRTKQTTVFTDDSGKANGLIFDSAGFLIACEGAGFGGRRVSRWNVQTKQRTTLADNYQGKKFNAPNDLCLDRQGRIYFTDPRYVGQEPRELEYRAVYRIDKNGSVTEVTHDVTKPNGIAISPDERTLYLADHDNGTDNIDPSAPPPKQGVMRIYAFPLNPNGTFGQRRTIVEFGEKKGCDGMTVDQQGQIYLTVRDSSRPGVMVINPDGKEVAFIPTGPPNQTGAVPVGLPSNVEFGRGDEISTLYVTVDLSLYRIRLKSQGFHRQF